MIQCSSKLLKDGSLIQHEDPRYNDTNHYLQLNRNIYGIKQAAQNQFYHLRDSLINHWPSGWA
jgi:hypothetical protein